MHTNISKWLISEVLGLSVGTGWRGSGTGGVDIACRSCELGGKLKEQGELSGFLSAMTKKIQGMVGLKCKKITPQLRGLANLTKDSASLGGFATKICCAPFLAPQPLKHQDVFLVGNLGAGFIYPADLWKKPLTSWNLRIKKENHGQEVRKKPFSRPFSKKNIGKMQKATSNGKMQKNNDIFA